MQATADSRHDRDEPVHLASAWEQIADAIPTAPALSHGDCRRSWAEFDDRSSRLATAFTAAGLGRSDRIAIDLFNCNEFLEAHFAALKIRAVPVHINYRYLAAELEYLLTDCGARAIVYHAALRDRLPQKLVGDMALCIEVGDASQESRGRLEVQRYEELVARSAPSPRIERSIDDMSIAYTGGTTGLPKAVVGMMGDARFVLKGLSRTVAGLPDELSATSPADAARWLHEKGAQIVIMPLSPLMHSTAMGHTSVPAMCVGAELVTLTGRRLDADEAVDTIERRGVTNVAIVGDAVGRPLLDALDARAKAGRPADLSSLRRIVSAGVMWSESVKRGLFAHAPHITMVDSCGSSEGAWIGSSVITARDDVFSTRFRAAPGVIVLDGSYAPMRPGSGEAGLIACPCGPQEYLGDPAKTANTFRTIGGTRYVIPGDLGIAHDDGSITLLGRGTSTINTGGEKVHPEEVEAVIRNIPDVVDCLVVGLPDPRWSQRVTAVVQQRIGSSLRGDDVTAVVRAALADYKVPKAVVFVERVPRFPNGKPDFERARAAASS